MIKVVHVIDGLGWAGMEQMVASLVRRIDKSRFQVTLLSEIPMKESVREQVDILKRDGIEVVFLQKGTRRKFVVSDYYRLFRKIRPDVVHSHSGAWRDSSLGAIAARVGKIFHTEHGIVSIEANWQTMQTYRLLSHFRDKIVAVSDDLAEALTRKVGVARRKLVTIHNGIDVDRFKPMKTEMGLRGQLGLNVQDILIIAVGRIDPIKDYATLIRSMAIVKQKSKGSRRLKAVIVGAEGMNDLSGRVVSDGLLKMRHDFGVEDLVLFLGRRTDVPYLLAESDVFVQTSLSEGLSMAIMEAMSCQLPVVATDVGGNREIIVHGKTGFLVPKKDYEAVADSLLQLVADEELRGAMGREGRRRIIEGFSLEAMARKYEGLYLF